MTSLEIASLFLTAARGFQASVPGRISFMKATRMSNRYYIAMVTILFEYAGRGGRRENLNLGKVEDPRPLLSNLSARYNDVL